MATTATACAGDDGGGMQSNSTSLPGGSSGQGPGSDGTGGAPTGLDGSGGPDGCATDFSCRASAPDGWQGPVVRRFGADGERPAACAEPWPTADLTFFDAYIEPGASECSCECVVDLAMLCYTGVWRHDGSDACDSYSEFVLLENECVPVDDTSGSLMLNMVGDGEPDCAAELQSDIPPPQWGLPITACRRAEEGAACGEEDGQCLPNPPEGFAEELCIYTGGDEPCPAGSVYASHELVYNGVADDTRNCAPCTCEDVAPLTCDGAVEAFGSEDCSGAAATTVDAGVCGEVAGIGSVRATYDGPATCAKLTETQFQGSVEAAGIFTYCCQVPA